MLLLHIHTAFKVVNEVVGSWEPKQRIDWTNLQRAYELPKYFFRKLLTKPMIIFVQFQVSRCLLIFKNLKMLKLEILLRKCLPDVHFSGKCCNVFVVFRISSYLNFCLPL